MIVLDLPDLDSIDPDHRARVEELLPRVDAVAWVIDPEKYADARLHDDFLHHWLARLDRQVLVLNKADRLRGNGASDVAADLERSIRRDVDTRPKFVPVLTVSAAEGSTGIAPLRAWLESARDAKSIVAGRLGAAAREATLGLAVTAGVDHQVPADSLLGPVPRRAALREAIDGTLALVDLPGAERQAVAATRARARPAGAGPFGRLTALIYRASGRQRRAADPAAYLGGWRGRGSLARPVEALRTAIADATAAAVPAMRPIVAATGEGAALASRIARSVDRVLSAQGDLPAPGSRLWPLIGLLQTVNTVALVVVRRLARRLADRPSPGRLVRPALPGTDPGPLRARRRQRDHRVRPGSGAVHPRRLDRAALGTPPPRGAATRALGSAGPGRVRGTRPHRDRAQGTVGRGTGCCRGVLVTGWSTDRATRFRPASADSAAAERRIATVARLLDDLVTIPGTRHRIGLDSVVGLIPGAGDLVTAGVGVWILLEAARFRLPPIVLARMVANVLVDLAVGAVPILGDLFDVAFRSNVRNLELFRRYASEPGASTASQRAFFIGVGLIGLGLLWLLASLLGWLLSIEIPAPSL